MGVDVFPDEVAVSRLPLIGAYDAATSYSPGALVYYQGNTYQALVSALIGVTPPSDPVKWQLVALGGAPFAPISQKTDGTFSIVCAGTGASTWKDVDPNGSANTRPLDIVFPNVTVGQTVKLRPHFGVTSGASAMFFDAATIVSGAVVHAISGGTGGIEVWTANASTATYMGIAQSYVVQAGDIQGGGTTGQMRVRMRFASAGSRTILGTLGFFIEVEGEGPFG